VSVHVSALRKALGDDNRSPRFIETVSRSGYRFIAPVIDDQGTHGACSIAVLPAQPCGAETSDAERSVGLAIADALIDRLRRWTQIWFDRRERSSHSRIPSRIRRRSGGRWQSMRSLSPASRQPRDGSAWPPSSFAPATASVSEAASTRSCQAMGSRFPMRWLLRSRRTPRGNTGKGALCRRVWELGRLQARHLTAAESS
jgi:ribosomal protein L18